MKVLFTMLDETKLSNALLLIAAQISINFLIGIAAMLVGWFS